MLDSSVKKFKMLDLILKIIKMKRS